MFHYWRRRDPPVFLRGGDKSSRILIKVIFSSIDIIEAKQIHKKKQWFFHFHVKNQLLAAFYKDSEPHTAPKHLV